ncbi:Ku protein [Georgenia sp. TF02-10]|uniref:non-homologous end joining protein Ku n=1 Tax=Georgenia sp. TF02-10 TaxID=2917725 RepID=UPI001FA7A526|nr:Ku protein [Georgenia sp. TF02-10]UNX53803.1 Ku protein [Georgenia sp. TF02-10]
MRAIWKGAITFGLVNVPVKLYSATESHDIPLHQVHDADGGRIRYQRRCEKCGEVVPYEHIDKAYDDGERTVVLTGEDLESLPVERSREIDVQEFVPTEQVDPIMMQNAYYLAPDSKSMKSYALLRRTLEETDRTAIVTFTLRQKTRLGALRVRDDVLVLQGLLWEDEVRQADFPGIDEEVDLSAKELQMSAALVSSFEADFDPAAFHDEYQEQLQQLITAKLEQGEALDTEETFGAPEEEEGGEVLDLMEALRRSVAASRKKAGTGAEEPADEETAEEAAEDEPAPRRRSAAARRKAADDGDGDGEAPAPRKAAAKKPAAKEPAAEKESAEKPAAKKPAAKKPAARKPAAKKTAAAERKPAARRTAEERETAAAGSRPAAGRRAKKADSTQKKTA